MGGLFSLPVTKTAEILFNCNAELVSFFEKVCVSRYLRACIMGNIGIFCAAVGLALSQAGMLNGTALGVVRRDLAVSLEWASELEASPWFFGPGAGRFHLQPGIT